jgi:hypothetical protein
MTPQDRINELAGKALTAETENAETPLAAGAPAIPSEAADPDDPPPIPTQSFQDTHDPEFQAMLDERARQLDAKRKRKSRLINLALLAALAGGGGWYHQSPAAQAKAAALFQTFRETGKDFRLLGSMTKEYDKQLEKIGKHSDSLDEATRKIGGDPSAANGQDDPNMDQEMRQIAGDDAVSTNDRNHALKDKFGGVQKLVGKKPASEPASP